MNQTEIRLDIIEAHLERIDENALSVEALQERFANHLEHNEANTREGFNGHEDRIIQLENRCASLFGQVEQLEGLHRKMSDRMDAIVDLHAETIGGAREGNGDRQAEALEKIAAYLQHIAAGSK